MNKTRSAIPNSITRTLVCVDQITDSDFSGTLYNPYLPTPIVYHQAKDIIIVLERFFNDIHYPQSYFEHRSFLDGKLKTEEKQMTSICRYLEDDVFTLYKGQVATFEIQVRYRKNASWQGELVWLEREHKEQFLSILELLKFLDAALIHTEPTTPS